MHLKKRNSCLFRIRPTSYIFLHIHLILSRIMRRVFAYNNTHTHTYTIMSTCEIWICVRVCIFPMNPDSFIKTYSHCQLPSTKRKVSTHSHWECTCHTVHNLTQWMLICRVSNSHCSWMRNNNPSHWLPSFIIITIFIIFLLLQRSTISIRHEKLWTLHWLVAPLQVVSLSFQNCLFLLLQLFQQN